VAHCSGISAGVTTWAWAWAWALPSPAENSFSMTGRAFEGLHPNSLLQRDSAGGKKALPWMTEVSPTAALNLSRAVTLRPTMGE